MAECGESHDFVYHGALNIYNGAELLKVVDAWRCRRCGVLRLGLRGPDVLGSTEGLLPDLEPGKHWVLFVCKSSPEPCFDVYQLRDEDTLRHRCFDKEESLVYRRGKGVMHSADGTPASMYYVYEVGKILRGHIDLSKTPPEVVSLIR